MNIVKFFDLMFMRAYLLSGKFSGGQEPSLLRACLFVSVALFVNFATVLFALEALFGIVLDLSKAIFFAANLVLLVACSVFAVIRRNSILADNVNAATVGPNGFAIYIVISLILFGVSAILLFNS